MSKAKVKAQPHLKAFLDMFPSHNTRTTYERALLRFFDWVAQRGAGDMRSIGSHEVDAFAEELRQSLSESSQRLNLVVLRRYFEHLLRLGIVLANPVTQAQCKRSRSPEDARKDRSILDDYEILLLLNVGEMATPKDYRDRALVALFVYAPCKVGTAMAMKVKDVGTKGDVLCLRRLVGKRILETPCHYELARCLVNYIAMAGLAVDQEGPLWRTAPGRSGVLSGLPMSSTDVYRVLAARARMAGITCPSVSRTLCVAANHRNTLPHYSRMPEDQLSAAEGTKLSKDAAGIVRAWHGIGPIDTLLKNGKPPLTDLHVSMFLSPHEVRALAAELRSTGSTAHRKAQSTNAERQTLAAALAKLQLALESAR